MATAGGQFSRIVRIGMKTKKRPPFTVSQTKGRRLYGQAGRQLWLTCTSYAGCAQSRPRWSVIAELCLVHPLPLRGLSLKGKQEIGTGENPPYSSRTTPTLPPFGALRHHLSPSVAGGTMGTGQCATYDTDGKCREVLFCPLKGKREI